MTRHAGLVLAAGGSVRFGSPKQLAAFEGAPLIEYPVSALKRAGLQKVYVVAGREFDAIQQTLRDVEMIRCSDWDLGQSESLRTGIAAAATNGAERVVVVLGDQPLLSAAAVQRTLAVSGEIVRATYGGEPGHPVVLDACTFPAIAELRGDSGARALVDQFRTVHVACDGLGSAADVDTPQDLVQLRASAK